MSLIILICTVLSLEYSIRAFQIFVFAVLRSVQTTILIGHSGTFHEELIDFCCVEVVNPLLNCIEPNTLGYHILAAFASDVKGCFVSMLSANRLSFKRRERKACATRDHSCEALLSKGRSFWKSRNYQHGLRQEYSLFNYYKRKHFLTEFMSIFKVTLNHSLSRKHLPISRTLTYSAVFFQLLSYSDPLYLIIILSVAPVFSIVSNFETSPF